MEPLEISSDALTAHLSPRGAALVGLYFLKDTNLKENTRNLVLGFADLDQHHIVPIYAGALVGPVANRISGGQIPLDSVIHEMPRNEANRTTLHSGPKGLHAASWEVATQNARLVTFATTLADGACGLPGTRKIIATYALDGPKLTLTITATTDRPTPMNIAAHPYWNLDGLTDIVGHRLHLPTNRYLPTDNGNLPTGQITTAHNDMFDFTTASRVPLDPALDVNFCLADNPRTTPHHAATLTGADGTSLRIATNAPGLQVYNGAFLPTIAGALTGDRDLVPYGGIALEPQHWPDAPHNQHFPQITLHPHQSYNQITTYELSRG